MKTKWIAISLALGSLLYSTAAVADGLFADAAPAANNNMLQPTSRQFVWHAGIDDDQQVYLGRLALQKSHNQAVRHFARRMIHDHSHANQRLATIAATEGLSLPPNSYTNSFAGGYWTNLFAGQMASARTGTEMAMPPMTRTNAEVLAVKHLQSISGPDFDRAYANAMVRDHQQAVAYFQNASHNLQDPRLRNFAKQTLPTLRKHYQLAQKLQDQVNSGNGS